MRSQKTKALIGAKPDPILTVNKQGNDPVMLKKRIRQVLDFPVRLALIKIPALVSPVRYPKIAILVLANKVGWFLLNKRPRGRK